MPVEIRELVVKVTVQPGPSDPQRSRDQRDAELSEDLVAECVEQVLRVLQRREER